VLGGLNSLLYVGVRKAWFEIKSLIISWKALFERCFISLNFIVHFGLMYVLLANWILFRRTKALIHNVNFSNIEVTIV
jgi:hypothetical protein